MLGIYFENCMLQTKFITIDGNFVHNKIWPNLTHKKLSNFFIGKCPRCCWAPPSKSCTICLLLLILRKWLRGEKLKLLIFFRGSTPPMALNTKFIEISKNIIEISKNIIEKSTAQCAYAMGKTHFTKMISSSEYPVCLNCSIVSVANEMFRSDSVFTLQEVSSGFK